MGFFLKNSLVSKLVYIFLFIFSVVSFSVELSSEDLRLAEVKKEISTSKGQKDISSRIAKNFRMDDGPKILLKFLDTSGLNNLENYQVRDRVLGLVALNFADGQLLDSQKSFDQFYALLDKHNLPRPSNTASVFKYKELRQKHPSSSLDLLNELDSTFSDQDLSDIAQRNAPGEVWNNTLDLEHHRKALELMSKGEVDQNYLYIAMKSLLAMDNPYSSIYKNENSIKKLILELKQHYNLDFSADLYWSSEDRLACVYASRLYDLTNEGIGESIKEIKDFHKKKGNKPMSKDEEAQLKAFSVADRELSNLENLHALNQLIDLGVDLESDCNSGKSPMDYINIFVDEGWYDRFKINEPCPNDGTMANINLSGCATGDILSVLTSYLNDQDQSDGLFGRSEKRCEISLQRLQLMKVKSNLQSSNFKATIRDSNNKPYVVKAESKEELLRKINKVFEDSPKKSN